MKLSLITSNKQLGKLPTSGACQNTGVRSPWKFWRQISSHRRLLHYYYFFRLYSAAVSNLFYRYWLWFIGDARLVLAVAPVGVPNWVGYVTQEHWPKLRHTRKDVKKKSRIVAILPRAVLARKCNKWARPARWFADSARRSTINRSLHRMHNAYEFNYMYLGT